MIFLQFQPLGRVFGIFDSLITAATIFAAESNNADVAFFLGHGNLCIL